MDMQSKCSQSGDSHSWCCSSAINWACHDRVLINDGCAKWLWLDSVDSDDHYDGWDDGGDDFVAVDDGGNDDRDDFCDGNECSNDHTGIINLWWWQLLTVMPAVMTVTIL